MRRRQLLTATAIGIAGIAGCSGGSGEGGTETPTVGPLATPEGTVRTLFDRLYGNDDVEAANELYHPDSEERIRREDFREFGGLSSMGAEVRETEVVSQSESEAEVHATVFYTTPIGSAENVDWFTLVPHDGEWLVMNWTPEALRDE